MHLTSLEDAKYAGCLQNMASALEHVAHNISDVSLVTPLKCRGACYNVPEAM